MRYKAPDDPNYTDVVPTHPEPQRAAEANVVRNKGRPGLTSLEILALIHSDKAWREFWR